MAQEYYTILTNAGLAYEAQSKANQTPIRLTHLAVGDGNGATYNPGQEATALRRETHRQEINALRQDEANPSWLLAEALLPDDVGGFTIREVGIYTDTGILYAIGKYPDSVKPILGQGSTKQFYVRAIFQTSNASIVTLVVDNNVVQATRAFVLDHVKSELEKRDHKNSVRVATTAAIVLSGTQTIDGIALVAGDRVLVKNQAAGETNGIYVVAGGAWARAADADASIEVTPGILVPVEQGTANADTIWQLVTDGAIVLGTTALTFELSGALTASQVDAEAGTNNVRRMTALRVFQALRSAAAKATEVLRGVLRVGTQDEVDAGVLDDVVVTPMKLRWGFAFSFEVNGYIVLPTWLLGFIVQWGEKTPTNLGAGSTRTESHIFPIEFPTVCLRVLGGPDCGGGQYARGWVKGNSITTSGVNIQVENDTGTGQGTQAIGSYYIALGK